MKFYIVKHRIEKTGNRLMYVRDKIECYIGDSKPTDTFKETDSSFYYSEYFDSFGDAKKYRDMLIRFRDHYRLMYLLDKCCGSLSVDDV